MRSRHPGACSRSTWARFAATEPSTGIKMLFIYRNRSIATRIMGFLGLATPTPPPATFDLDEAALATVRADSAGRLKGARGSVVFAVRISPTGMVLDAVIKRTTLSRPATMAVRLLYWDDVCFSHVVLLVTARRLNCRRSRSADDVTTKSIPAHSLQRHIPDHAVIIGVLRRVDRDIFSKRVGEVE
jgi:hypothetical protein